MMGDVSTSSSGYRVIVLPAVVFILVAGGCVMLWSAYHGRQTNVLEAQAAVMAKQTALRLEEAVQIRLELARQLRDEWLIRPPDSREQFERRVGPLIRRFPGFLAINWIDPHGVIQWVVPREPNRRAEGRDLHFHPFAAKAFMTVERSGEDSVFGPFTLYQGGLGFVAYFPIRDGGRNLGYVNAVFRIGPLIRSVLGPGFLGHYAVKIRAGDLVVYDSTVDQPGLRTYPPRTAEVPIGKGRWTLVLLPIWRPQPLLHRLLDIAYPTFGILIGLIAAFQVRRAFLTHQRLAESEARYRNLFEDSVDGVYISTPDGRFTDVNEATVRLFGARSKAELLSIDILHDLYIDPKERAALMERLEKDGAVHAFPLHLRTLDGRELLVTTSARATHDSRGRIVSIQGIIRDETESRRIQEEMIRLQHMEALGELARGVAHDFNNVLSAITANLSALEMRAGDPALQPIIQRIERSVEAASGIVRQLLQFARGERARSEPVDLNTLVEDTVTMLEGSLDPRITVIVEMTRDLPPVQGDLGRLQQLLLNLLLNARDAMPDGGELRISTAVAGTPPIMEAVEGSSQPAGGAWIELRVTDTGHGMDGETLRQIFEPFFTTKGENGTGLGLTVAYRVAREHGGVVTATSKPGSGTTFTVHLPAADRGTRPDSS